MTTRLFSKRPHPVLETIGQIVVLLSCVMAVLYGGGWYPDLPGFPLAIPALVKGSCVGLLALFVLLNLRTLNHILLFLALVASTVGDILLINSHDLGFLQGLFSFMGAHFFFILLFAKNGVSKEVLGQGRIKLCAFFWAATILLGFWLYPHLEKLLWPSVAYFAVLTTMCCTALLSQFPVKMVGLGASLFYISDAVLGVDYFIGLPDYSRYIIWAAYFLGQLFITLGVMLTEDQPVHFGRYRFD